MHKLHPSPLWHKLHLYFGICNSSSRHRSYSLMNSTSLLFLYICSSHPHLIHLLVLVKGEFKLEKERVGESRGRLCERKRESWRARVDLGEPKWLSVCISNYYQRSSSDLGELLHSLIVLCISTEQLISNRRRIWLGFPLVAFSLVIDLTSLCLIEFLVVFHCAYGLCSIYNYLTYFAA